MRYFFAFIFLLLIFIFPQRAYADVDFLTVWHHEISCNGDVRLVSYGITIPPWFSIEQRALIIFSQALDGTKIFAPNDVKVFDAFFFEDYAHLVVNFSSDILNYGGTYFEYRLVEKLLANAAGMPDVAVFSILIEWQTGLLPEGTLLCGMDVVFAKGFSAD